MTDGETFLALICISGVVTFGLAYLLAGRRKHWSDRKVRLIAAFPVPGLLMVLTAFVVSRAWFATIVDPASCGIDACGMAMMFGAMGFVAGLFAYLISLFSAWMGVRLGR